MVGRPGVSIAVAAHLARDYTPDNAENPITYFSDIHRVCLSNKTVSRTTSTLHPGARRTALRRVVVGVRLRANLSAGSREPRGSWQNAIQARSAPAHRA